MAPLLPRQPGPPAVVAARDDAELDSCTLSEDGTTAALLWNVAGRSELAFLDLASGTLTPTPPLTAEVARDLAFARDGRTVACSLLGAAVPISRPRVPACSASTAGRRPRSAPPSTAPTRPCSGRASPCWRPNDTNCPVVEAEQVVDSLRTRGVPVELVLFPDEGHGFRKTRNRITAAVAIARWFAQHLAG